MFSICMYESGVESAPCTNLGTRWMSAEYWRADTYVGGEWWHSDIDSFFELIELLK